MMYARRSVALAHSQYHETDLAARIESATPHALVALLYDQLIETIDVMLAMLAQGKAIGQDRHSQRAQSILVGLQTSLDFQTGGSVAEALEGVYQAMSAQLASAIAMKDAARLRELRTGAEDIASSWKKIAS